MARRGTPKTCQTAFKSEAATARSEPVWARGFAAADVNRAGV